MDEPAAHTPGQSAAELVAAVLSSFPSTGEALVKAFAEALERTDDRFDPAAFRAAAAGRLRDPSLHPSPLREFVARAPADSVKTDLELIHDRCRDRVCDVEPDDTLDVLVGMASDHRCAPPDEPDGDTAP